jgi:hypothetical protein
MNIPSYPEFIPLCLELKDEVHTRLFHCSDGVSEFSFAGLYLFRNRYQYTVSKWENMLLIKGIQPPHNDGEEARNFFLTPQAAPSREVLEELFRSGCYWKNIPDSVLLTNEDRFKDWGITITEDRDNFDYLYLRSELAELAGKKFHKKRNLIAQFHTLYTCVEKPIDSATMKDAMEVLELWNRDKEAGADFVAAQEALELFSEFQMKGSIYYIEDKPVAWCLGESIAGGSIFTIHFEKALDDFKGLYQYINQCFAASLPEHITHINREQDLGSEGLRHAKMSYRPSGFVRKCVGIMSALSNC